MRDAYLRENYTNKMAKFFRSHHLFIGLSLVFFGVADLWFVMPKMYAGLQRDWHADWRNFYVHVPEWVFTVPVVLAISLLGSLILCAYCLKDIQPENVDRKQEAAILVTTLGFTYQVIGAWPLWSQPYPWPWQLEIAKYGNLIIFPLYIGSLIALIIGAASLYIYSKKFHGNLS
jgi:hypothetical protein